jgi:hypothetical protein
MPEISLAASMIYLLIKLGHTWILTHRTNQSLNFFNSCFIIQKNLPLKNETKAFNKCHLL